MSESIIVTVFPRGQRSVGKPVRVTLAQLHDFLRVGSKANTKDDLGGWCPAQFVGNHRKLEKVLFVHCAVLDIDNSAGKIDGIERMVPPDQVVTIDKMLASVGDVDTFIYTSFRNKPEWPKFRVVMPFDRPLNAVEYPKFWQVLSQILKQQGITTDPQAKDASRLWYLSGPAASHFETQHQAGGPLKVDDYLALYVEPPKPVRVLNNTAPNETNKIERARRYAAKCIPAVSGSGGHKQTWSVCCSVVRGFDLDDHEALYVLNEWNNTCDPPWSDRDLLHKINDARTKGTSPEIGAFLRPALSANQLEILRRAQNARRNDSK